MAESAAIPEPRRSPCDLSAAELCRLMARKELSSREVVAAHLERIEQHDRALNAFTRVFRERALAEAERADKEPRRGPLHGLPVSVKENLDIAGEATTFGVVGRAAVRATSPGWETIATWLDGISTVAAPMRAANCRSASGGIA